MESTPEGESAPLNSSETLVSYYSNVISNRFSSFFSDPISSSYSSLLNKATNIYGSSSKRSRRRPHLFIPFNRDPKADTHSSATSNETNTIFDVLEDIMENTLENLHIIQKHLEFWQSMARRTKSQRAYFMICEQGPYPFSNGTTKVIRDFLADGSGMQNLYYSASCYVARRTNVLTNLRTILATFLGEFYTYIESSNDILINDLENSLPYVLVAIFDMFMRLEVSIGHFHEKWLCDPTPNDIFPHLLKFARVPEVSQGCRRLIDCENGDAYDMIYENLQMLDSYVSMIVSEYRKPRKVTLRWMRYSCGIVGISLCSLFLLRHSTLMGSPDIGNWAHEAKDLTTNFWKDYLEQPIVVVRDVFFGTFREKQKSEDAVTDSLHRTLHAFHEQRLASDQAILETFMGRYEKDLMDPIDGLVGGQLELERALQIEAVQNLIDIEQSMFELHQTVRAYQNVNFELLASFSTLCASIVLAMLVRVCFKRGGKVTHVHKKLFDNVQKALMHLQTCERRESSRCKVNCEYGMLLYHLDVLQWIVDRHTISIEDWMCMREDIVDLAKPGIGTEEKFFILSQIERLFSSAHW